MEGIITALNAATKTAADGCMDAISGVLPMALPVMAAIVVVGIGIKIFKKVAR